MSPGSWLVKLHHYSGAETVIRSFPPEERLEARAYAEALNADSQSDRYRVEKFDPAKFSWPGVTR